jgi:E3 ubiquitin-protein ligase TRIP12
MEKISAEIPSAIVKEGGLGALLNYLPFFSTNVQRTAVTAAANCCRNISADHFTQIRDVFPILRETLTQADQRLVEQATLAVVRTIEAYRHNPSHLEGLLDVPTVVAVNSLLMPSGGSPLLSPSTYTHLLRALTASARGSAKVAIAFLEAGMTNTIYQILTGVLPSSHDEDEQGGAEGGQGLAGGVADMAVLQNLAHRPKDQVEESLALICELLPPAPRDGVFDARNYSEKNLGRIKKGRKSERSERPTRRSSRVAPDASTPGSTGDNTPTTGTAPLPTLGAGPELSSSHAHASLREASQKAKRDAEMQIEQRTELFKAQPELLAKFVKAIVPVLVDVYAASVTQRVRTKVLTGLTKAVAFADAESLRATLKVRVISPRLR